MRHSIEHLFDAVKRRRECNPTAASPIDGLPFLMSSGAVVARATADIEAGQLWKARDRLRAHLASNPADQAALDLMGTVLYLMRDLPDAARYWQLTERSGPDVTEAMAAFEARYRRSPVEAFRALPTKRTTADAYPPSAAGRLRARREAAIAAGYREPVVQPNAASRGSGILALVVAAVIVVSFVVGLITIITYLARGIG